MACVTGFQVKINGKHSLKCVGKNPRLAQAKSKNDKNLSGLLNQIEAGKIGIHTFTNASAYTVNETDVKIISIEFAEAEEMHVQFFGIVLVDVSADKVELIGTAAGTVMVPVPVLAEDGTETTREVSVEAELPVAFSIDGNAAALVRYEFNDEEILTHYPAETWGSGSIETGGCIASISGQGMAAAPAWDGKITLEETVSRFLLGSGLAVKGFVENVGIGTMELVQRQMAERMGRVAVRAFGVVMDTSEIRRL